MNNQSVQCNKVYEHFGRAVYWSQCIEQAMIHLLVLLDLFPNAVADSSDEVGREVEYDKFIKSERKRTMGQLLGRLQKLGIPHDQLEEGLKEILIKRNLLAHSYFSDRALSFVSEAGRLQMINELEIVQQSFIDVESDISVIYRQVSEKYGFTEEMTNNVMGNMLAEANADL